MARLARGVVPGEPHQITQRGNRRQEPDTGEPQVRFDEREVKTEQDMAREAPGNSQDAPAPPRCFSTLPGF